MGSGTRDWDKPKYCDEKQTKLEIVCNCCSITLENIYHMINKQPYCNRCYTSSHYANAPEICPYVSAVRKVIRLLQGCELGEYEAAEIIKFVRSRVRGGI